MGLTQPPQSSGDEVVEILLPVFTDEELAVVSGPDVDERRLVPLERVETLSGEARASALAAARRSLRARGYVDGTGKLREDGTLSLILSARRSPTGVVVAERMSDRTKRFLYGQEDESVLEERVEDGLHFFRMSGIDRAAAELASFADPHSWALEDAPGLRSDGPGPAPWQAEVEATIAGAEVVTRVFSVRRTARDRTDQVVVYVAAQPDGVWVLSGLSDAEGAQLHAAAKKVSAVTLAGVMATCLRLEPGEVLADERLD